MDKLKKYSKIIKEEMERRATVTVDYAPDLKNHLLINKSETEFALFSIGKWRGKFRHGIIMHFHLKDDKVFLYANNTDVEIGEVLAEKGIPKSDIVIAFVPEYERDLAYAGAQ